MGRRVSIMAKFYPVGPLRSGPDCSKSSPPGNVLSASSPRPGPGCTKKLSQNLAHHPNRHCHEIAVFISIRGQDGHPQFPRSLSQTPIGERESTTQASS